jgi:hypothetical protein
MSGFSEPAFFAERDIRIQLSHFLVMTGSYSPNSKFTYWRENRRESTESIKKFSDEGIDSDYDSLRIQGIKF